MGSEWEEEASGKVAIEQQPLGTTMLIHADTTVWCHPGWVASRPREAGEAPHSVPPEPQGFPGNLHGNLAVSRHKLLVMPCDCYWSHCLLLQGSVFCFACNRTMQPAVRETVFVPHRCTNPASPLTKCSLLCWWGGSQAAKICKCYI